MVLRIILFMVLRIILCSLRSWSVQGGENKIDWTFDLEIKNEEKE